MHRKGALLDKLVRPSHENSLARCLGRSEAWASKCCLPLHPQSLPLSGSWISAHLAGPVRGPGCGGAGPPASYLPEPTFSAISPARSLLDRRSLFHSHAFPLKRGSADAPAETRLTCPRALARMSVGPSAPTVQEVRRTAFSAPLAAPYLQRTSFPS